MTQVFELVELASKATGSDSKLARALGVDRTAIYQWKIGKAVCPPEEQASMAALAGIDPIQTLCRAHIERHAGTPKGERLLSVLGKLQRQTGAATATVLTAVATGATLAAAAFEALSGLRFIRCINRIV